MKFIATLAIGALMLSTPVLAVGGMDDEPPKPTPTSKCPDGQIWDADAKACADAQESRFDDKARIKAARELAFVGRADSSLTVLDALNDQTSDAALTYKGFAHRSAGQMDLALGYYDAALEQNPDNVLARSYYGQALVLLGDREGAQAQLQEITARVGRETWPAFALRMAIRSGRTEAY